MAPDEVITNHAYRVTVEPRIVELWRYRQWFRRNRWADWPDIRFETETELRCLVGIARRARAMARVAIERADPITQAKAAEADLWAGDWYIYPAGVGR